MAREDVGVNEQPTDKALVRRPALVRGWPCLELLENVSFPALPRGREGATMRWHGRPVRRRGSAAKGQTSVFDFDALYDNDLTEINRLASEPLQSLDGEVGRISHLLIGPTTHKAEWAVVVDAHADHHLVPVNLIGVEDERLLLRLLRSAVDSNLAIDNPEELSPYRLTMAAKDALRRLTGQITTASGSSTVGGAGVVVGIDPSLLAGAGLYELRSINDLADSIALGAVGDQVPESPEQEASAEAPMGPEAHGQGQLREIGGQRQVSEEPYRAAPPESVGEAVRDEPASQIGRHMIAELPRAVHVGTRFSVQVQINEQVDSSKAARFLPGVTGGTITVNAVVPVSFTVHGELTHDINVPESGDSNPVLFSFTPNAIGTFGVRLTAFAGGSYLGALHTEVSVGHDSSGTAPLATSALSGAPPRAGEVSLQITFDDLSRTFRFLFVAGGDWRAVPSKPIQGDLQTRLEAVIAELDLYARAKSGLSESDAQQRIRIRGFELWRDLVPDEIKAAIFDHLDDITQLTIISDREIVPWELLYPQSTSGDEPGFLVSLFPVNRWVMAKPWTDRISLKQPMFVVPDNSPTQAADEVDAISKALKTANPSTIRSRQQLLSSLTSPSFDLLHFACHNSFATGGGSHIAFPDAPFAPFDLALHAASQPLKGKSSLVFINACRTQGTTPTYTGFENWAKNFLDLGATAVIGTSWAVRDRTARPFAEAVYERLKAGDTLGQSVATARTRVSTTLGDPTWLAYTVYGNPNAKVEGQ